MTYVEAQRLDHGLYLLFWKSGGESLAAVGSDSGGRRWFAATNWVSGVPSFDWRRIDHAVKFDLEVRP